MRRSALTLAGLGLLLLVAALVRAQEPQIKVKVNLVSVSFVARDTNGALVDKLTQDDVDIFEDAVPQKISYFREERGCAADAGSGGGRERKPGSFCETAQE